MNANELFQALRAADSTTQVEEALLTYESDNQDRVSWAPLGERTNNRGVVEVSGDPGRALVERLTNAIDAVLDAEHQRHDGIPECRTPREAAMAWLNVPDGGLSELTPAQRRVLANAVALTMLPGDGRESRIVEIRDRGTGLTPLEMPGTILSLNESNKIQKHYLAGTFGQGGSATFAACRYSLIASRTLGQPTVGFTVVKFLDLPADQYKTGHYVYFLTDGAITEAATDESFEPGTLVRHIGYDLSRYTSPVGPSSVYGLLNEVLFDPVLPVWLDSQVHGYRRVIKGSRNALNGAVDDGDATRRGPTLAHSVRLYYVALGEFGRIGVEYWVLERPTRENKKPSAAFVNPSRPIVLTINGQTHAELSQVLIRKRAELPHLAQRLIMHVDCNYLTPDAKRALFVSNREDARRGLVHEMIEEELVRILRSDDELTRLNTEARQDGAQERNEEVRQQMRREVARLLRLQGLAVGEGEGAQLGDGDRPVEDQLRGQRRPRPAPTPIDLHEPPTFIRLVWPENQAIPFFAGQRRYVRVETDAQSAYHDANRPERSRTNLVTNAEQIRVVGSTPLQSGRLRVIVEATENIEVGQVGSLRVELMRRGLPILSDQRATVVVERPPVREGRRQTTLPPFDVRPVNGPDDPQWAALSWPDGTGDVAFSWEMEGGEMVVYYSTAFPKFASRHQALEAQDVARGATFTNRYELWLAVHSFLALEDERGRMDQVRTADEDADAVEFRDRVERVRVATLASLFAAREAHGLPTEEEAD